MTMNGHRKYFVPNDFTNYYLKTTQNSDSNIGWSSNDFSLYYYKLITQINILMGGFVVLTSK